jgi:hypothetical protein
MKTRAYITKSKAGHYTLTVRATCHQGLSVRRGLIESLEQARAAFPALLQELKAEATRRGLTHA